METPLPPLGPLGTVPATITVSLVEDDDQVRDHLVKLINSTPGLRCLGAYRDPRDALRALPTECPTVVLMDIRMEGMSGIDCVRRLKTLMPDQLVVMLTAYEDDDLIFQALSAGATGYLLKQSPPAELMAAIAEVHRGGAPMSSNIARKVIQSFHAPATADTQSDDKLTPRESEILASLSRGYSYKEIGDSLGLSYAAVDFHIRNIYNKLHVHSRAAAVAKFRDAN